MSRRIATILADALATAAAAVVLLSAPGSAHAAGWVASPPLSTSGTTPYLLQLAVAPDGGRTVVWDERGVSAATRGVVVRTAAPDGAFGPEQRLPADTTALAVATAADGTTALVWSDYTDDAVHVAVRAAGATTFAERTPLSVLGAVPGTVSAAYSGGDLYLSFESFSPDTHEVDLWAARLTAGATGPALVPGAEANGAVERHTNAAGDAQFSFADQAIAADGRRVTIAFETRRVAPGGSSTTATVSFSALAGGATRFALPGQLDTLTNPTMDADLHPQIVGGAGHTYLSWYAAGSSAVDYVDLAGSGVRQAGTPGRGIAEARAAVDGTGALVLAVGATLPGPRSPEVLLGFRVAPGAQPGAPVPLTPDGVQRELAAVDAGDDTSLVLPWRDNWSADNDFSVDAITGAADGSFGAAEPVTGVADVLGSPSSTPVAAVGPAGRMFAAWVASGPTADHPQVAYVAERDATPPAIAGLSAPATATVGDRVALALSASDALAGGVTVAWDFGDGTTARGAAVTHAFATAGTYTLTATATDAVGNVAMRTATVVVGPRPASGGAGGGAAPPPADRTPPALGPLSAAHRRFRVGTKGVATIARAGATRKTKRKAAPVGTTLVLRSLSERSTLVIAFERHLAHGRRRTDATLVRAGVPAGPVRLPFSGRIGRAALAPGTYTVRLVAIDGAGNRSAAATTTITVVSR